MTEGLPTCPVALLLTPPPPPPAVGFGVLCHRHKCACGFVKDDFIDVVHGNLLCGYAVSMSVCVNVHTYVHMYDIRQAKIVPVWDVYPQKRIKNKKRGVIGASGEYLLTKINKNTHLMAQFCG